MVQPESTGHLESKGTCWDETPFHHGRLPPILVSRVMHVGVRRLSLTGHGAASTTPLPCCGPRMKGWGKALLTLELRPGQLAHSHWLWTGGLRASITQMPKLLSLHLVSTSLPKGGSEETAL